MLEVVAGAASSSAAATAELQASAAANDSAQVNVARIDGRLPLHPISFVLLVTIAILAHFAAVLGLLTP
jgi:hypothetical protein